MKYRHLGKSGLQVSELSFGSWVTFGNQIEDKVADRLIHVAYDAGINFFDNAEIYANGKSEKVMGTILKNAGWDRSSFVVSSKVFWGGELPNQTGLSRKHIFEACENALKRLQVDYLDLYFCHRPDQTTPIEETVRAMTDLIHQGKILYWGTSEWSAEEIMHAFSCAREFQLIPPTMEQPQYNMLERAKVEKEFHRLYETIGIGLTIWSPLASGLLTGKYNDGKIPAGSRASLESMPWIREKLLTGADAKKRLELLKKLEKFADKVGLSMAQLALLWCLRNPNVSTVILGATKEKQLVENLKVVDKLDVLRPSDFEKVEAILGNKPF